MKTNDALRESTAIESRPSAYRIGIDVGSTTVKIAIVYAATGEVRYTDYVRHHAYQASCVRDVLARAREITGASHARVAICGSGGKALAEAIGASYVQEVVANARAIQALYPAANTAIELGGQDAKMIFFTHDDATGALEVSDMRMNGSCAGGTGAFIDEIAALLDTPIEDFDALAAQGTRDCNISGRCGVYAKTDIQPLLNQGVPTPDIARSAFHAIAKQTIGGLAQGLDITPPVIFEGGPLTFNPTLVEIFAERLGFDDADVITPDHAETIVAVGAALSIDVLFPDAAPIDLDAAVETLAAYDGATARAEAGGAPYFATDAELAEFKRTHTLPDQAGYGIPENAVTRAYLGIDSGSTTTKLALIDEAGRLITSFYAPNEGEPVDVALGALKAIRDECARKSATLDIVGTGTIGYGETLMAEAFGADYHTVETVAHVRAARTYVPDVSFILDIGGQDMKAMWIDDDAISNIVVNEACSSGCGSFLEAFAKTLGFPVGEIADAAFRSKAPANLGSRCTVFMTSSIVSAQRAGYGPDDIMAGLTRSIIENVFTKVVRVPNIDSLGGRIVVQGGTFMNDAVLRAFEDFVGRPVTRAPYPGLMGAIGAALLAKDHRERVAANAGRSDAPKSRFIGFDALDDLTYTQVANVPCAFCANQCNRTVIEFSTGARHVTGNRCERGEIVGDVHDDETREKLRAIARAKRQIPDLFAERERLVFQDWPYEPVADRADTVVGLPRVLDFWEHMPFWSTFFRTLGFTVRQSHPSTRALYENGLSAVASDTVCFPAKLVHGHVRDLVAQGATCIFMPSVTTVSSENPSKTSISMCAVVKGYPQVIRNSDNPQDRFGVAFYNPLFHWYADEDRTRQLSSFMERTFGVPPAETALAIEAGDSAQSALQTELERRGREALDDVAQRDGWAVVLASRPYHNDALVNHDLPTIFADQGALAIPPDMVPGVRDIDLSNSRIDIVNNYHARMLASAVIAAKSPHLEYAQIVSFNCGHDAYLTDEITRIMHEIGAKSPLVLKVDESDASGPLRIRVRSFIETVGIRRDRDRAAGVPSAGTGELRDPYPVKFQVADRRMRTVLVPNTSHAFSRLMTAAFNKQGLRCVSLPIGRDDAIRLGKRYVHNDICFPAQIVIGEALAALKSGEYDPDTTAIAMGKYVGDCRLTHYSALLRKALDDAGFPQVPIVTNDDHDSHNLHPGFKMSTTTAIRIASALPMIDVLEELLRKMRPYELHAGDAERAFDEALDCVMDGLERGGTHGATAGFRRAIDIMKNVEYDRSNPRPTVLIVGEYLLYLHPGANHDIEAYLEANGMEVIEARMTDVIRKTYFYQDSQIKEYHVKRPFVDKAWFAVANDAFEHAHDRVDRIAKAHPLYEPASRITDIARESDPIIHHTFDAGEGILIPGEILHHAAHGCKAFVILQPFGCLPNHVVGRGIARKIKELYPHVSILPLDYDPDVSFANVENRLQMLIMNAKGSVGEPDELAEMQETSDAADPADTNQEGARHGATA